MKYFGKFISAFYLHTSILKLKLTNMKNLFLLICILLYLTGCKNDKATDTKYDYAYIPIDHEPLYWEAGDQMNLVNALKALKAFETGKVDESVTYFADSLQFTADNIDMKIPRDTLKFWFQETWKNTSSIKVEMNDYESVVSKDKKKEYVTLWFKEIVTDKSGKADSVAYVDDIGFKNGKIISMDEKTRHYPKGQ
jgi:hypothetical protein